MCVLVSIYLKFYSECIKSRKESPDVLNTLHKFSEVLIYISIIVDCYEH